MEIEDIERLERMLESWSSIHAIYRRGSVDGFVRVRVDHWRMIESIMTDCHDWAQTAKAILENER